MYDIIHYTSIPLHKLTIIGLKRVVMKETEKGGAEATRRRRKRKVRSLPNLQ